MYDLVIKGGFVADGTGAPGRVADVGINDGRIAAIREGLSGKQELDANGHIVAPGFIDIHTHYDAQVFWDPALSPSCFHGVTTVVAGNCGFSLAPTRVEHRELIARTLENVEDMDVKSLAEGVVWEFQSFPEYLDLVERRGVGLNYAAYIGHTALRLYVMGDAAYERAARPDERTRMQDVLREAMHAGAAGFATSFAVTHRGADGKPVPSRFADREEFEALLQVMTEVGKGVVSIAPGEQCGVADMYKIQPEVGVNFTYGALLAMPNGSHYTSVDVHRDGWGNGARVYPQITPRPLTFSMTMNAPIQMNTNDVMGELMALDVAGRRKAYEDPAWRAKLKAEWAGKTGFFVPRWESYEVVDSPSHPELNGRRVAALAVERGVDPIDVILDLALEEPDLAMRVRCLLANDDPDEVAFLLREENCTLGLSDAGAHVGQLCDAPQATDFLGKWVRERNVMPIEQAVRKLSGVQADILGLTDRGYLREGAWADIVVFDLGSVAPGEVRRVRDFPGNCERLTADTPSGVRHVLVNGTPIRIDGAMTDAASAGQLVRL